MFDAIAATYERVNTLATFGRDAAWRRRAVAAAGVRPGDIVVDVCCGTCDLLRTFAAARPAPRGLLGVDFASGMLAHADLSAVAVPVQLVRADALRLPLGDDSVDVVSCAFGVRNFADAAAGLREMARVLRPGGRLVILEFAPPSGRLRRGLWRFYCDRVLPRLGAWVSGDASAYRYLPRSIETYESAEALAERMAAAGLRDVVLRRMHLGGVVLYRGVKR